MEDDTKIIQSVLEGNINDFEKLYKKYLPLAHYNAKRYVKDNDERKDVVQITFIKIFYALYKYDKKISSFKNFFCVCVRNEAINWARSNSIRRDKYLSLELEGFLFPDIISWDTPETEYEAEERSQLVKSAIGTLSPRGQLDIRMWMDGHSQKEIALADNNTTLGAVGKQIWKAKKAIRKELDRVLL